MMSVVLSFLVGISSGLAQEAPAASAAQDQPLAVPAQGPPPPRRPEGARPEPGPMSRTPEQLAALRRYRDERLQVRAETEIRPGSSMVVGGWWGGAWRPGPYGRWHYGFGFPGALITEPPTVERVWGVYRGPQRLTVPELLQVTGQTDRARELDRDIGRARTASTFWFTVAGAGVASAVVGMVGLSVADERGEALLYNQVVLGGAGAAATGLIVGSFPASKVSRLTHDVPRTMTLQEAQALVAQRNEALRNELGLTPNDVWQIESDPPAP